MDVQIASPAHTVFANEISEAYSLSAQVRGTGIAERSPAYIRNRMEQGDAVIALDEGSFAGFCYIEVWGNWPWTVFGKKWPSEWPRRSF